MIDILVTMPAYNEEECVGAVVREIAAVLHGENYAIVVVSDGSTDRTDMEAKAAGAVVCYKQHGGLADAFRYEMKVAASVWPNMIVHTDADGQFDARDIPRMAEAVRESGGIVLGSRLKGNPKSMPLERQLLNEWGAWCMSQWLKADIQDATTGLRAFVPEVALLPIKSNFSFTLEQLIRARQAGFQIRSIPVTLYKRRNGTSKQVRSSARYVWNTMVNLRRMIE